MNKIKKYYYSKENIQEMIKNYKQGLLLKKIGKKFNTTPDSIWHLLHYRGIIFNRKRKILDKQTKNIKKVISDYKRGLSTSEIGKKHGVAKSTIGSWLKKSKVKLRTTVECNKLRRKQIKPQNGMTKNKSLLLGILLADGSESKITNSITLAAEDKFLQKFSVDLVKKIYKINGNIMEKEGRVVWYSENMKDDIHKHVPTLIHKSEIYTHVPQEILNNTDFAKAFLKGYFSCDGAVLLNVKKTGNLTREVSTFSKNLYIFNNLCDILETLDIKFNVCGNFIRISSKINLIKFQKEIGLLPMTIQKGKYWIGFKKDGLLNLINYSFLNRTKHNFDNKQEKYSYLHNLYRRIN